MRKLLSLIVVLCACSGCRMQTNKTIITNYGNKNQFESLSEGKQAADKELGDIAPTIDANLDGGAL